MHTQSNIAYWNTHSQASFFYSNFKFYLWKGKKKSWCRLELGMGNKLFLLHSWETKLDRSFQSCDLLPNCQRCQITWGSFFLVVSYMINVYFFKKFRIFLETMQFMGANSKYLRDRVFLLFDHTDGKRRRKGMKKDTGRSKHASGHRSQYLLGTKTFFLVNSFFFILFSPHGTTSVKALSNWY